MSEKNNSDSLQVTTIISYFLIGILCIHSDKGGQCSKCAFTISIFAVSMLYCIWINQTHLQLFWNRGARRGCAILPWRNVSWYHMMVRGGLHISKSRTNPWGTTQSLTQTQALGSNFLSLIIKFAPVELDIYMEINILVEHCIPYIYYSWNCVIT